MARKLILLLLHTLFRLIAHIDIEGFENLPKSGAYIGVSNHIGRLDAGLVFHLTDRQDIIMTVAEKYQKQAIWRFIVKHLDLMWIDRYNADFQAIREVQRRLKKGEALALAPEGTRSPDGTLQLAQPGGAYLAAKMGVPIVPIALVGTEDAYVVAQLKRLQRIQIKVRVGKPFAFPKLERHNRQETLARYTDEIMCRIASLLPPSHRGVYADHPRLPEFLTAQQHDLPEG